MSDPAENTGNFSDAELDELYKKLQDKNADCLSPELVRAQQALNLIAEVRDQHHPDTAREFETINDLLNQSRQQDLGLAQLPERVGRFEIKKLVGRGGFGVVLLAYDPDLGREVALKIPKPEIVMTPELQNRFLREGRAAAALAHPNIAPVYQAGRTGGFFFIASQYIAGGNLTDLQSHRPEILTPKSSAAIVARLAEAMQHAHQRGVVHRDLKPDNIMVESIGDLSSEAKIADHVMITDFGLAKSTFDQHETQEGSIIGTPAFMSPEHAGAGEIGPASDIYSLGAILYQLLVGSPPFTGKNIVEVIAAIRDREPKSPAMLNSDVSRDLSAICMKCLEKKPSARYASAFELQSDLNRFINGEPVKARAISQLGRGMRWIRGNPQVAATVALVLAIMTGSLIWISLERNFALQEAEKANISAKRSKDVLQVVMDSFENLSPQGGATPELSAKNVLVKAKDSIKDSELDDIGRGLLLTTISDCLTELSNYELAIEAADEATELLGAAQGEEHADTLAARFSLAVATRWSGEVEQAIPLYLEVLEARERKLGSDAVLTIDTRAAIGACYHEMGQIEESLAMFEDVYEARKRAFGQDHDFTLGTMANLGVLYQATGRLDEAIKIARHVVELRLAEPGPEHPDTLSSMHHLAKMLVSGEQYEEAFELQKTIYQRRLKRFGNDHVDTHTAAFEVANLRWKLGNFDEAIKLFKETISAFSRLAGPKKYETIVAKTSLAEAYQAMGRHDEAISLLQSVVATRKETKGPNHRYTLISQNDLGRAYLKASQTKQAIIVLDSTLAEQIDSIGEAHSTTLQTKSDLALTHAKNGDLELAARMLDEVQTRREDCYLKTHPVTAHASVELARMKLKLGFAKEAQSGARGYLDFLGDDYPNEWRIARANSILGAAILAQGDPRNALVFLEKAYEGLEQGTALEPPAIQKEVLRETIGSLVECARASNNKSAEKKWRLILEKEL